MFKVCLAGTYPEGTLKKLQNALPCGQFQVTAADTQEKFDAVTDADAIVLRILKMPREAFPRFTHLRLVIRWGAGYDSVDIQEAGRRNIKVTNTPGANAYAVAELAVGLMISVGRNLVGYFNNVCQNDWDRNEFPTNISLNGKLVGLVGGGNIGRQVAQRVRSFGASVQYYDVFRLPVSVEKEYGLTYVSLEELLRTSDVVTLHVPLLDSTYHIIGAEQLAAMKKDAILINTARGGLVDDAALLAALQGGKLLAAGLDCVEDEKSKTTQALCRIRNVVVTPHIGGTTSDLASAMIPMICENLMQEFEGKEVSHVVNAQFLPHQLKT